MEEQRSERTQIKELKSQVDKIYSIMNEIIDKVIKDKNEERYLVNEEISFRVFKDVYDGLFEYQSDIYNHNVGVITLKSENE